MYLYIFLRDNETSTEIESENSEELLNELFKLEVDIPFDLALASPHALLTMEYNGHKGSVYFENREGKIFKNLEVSKQNFFEILQMISTFCEDPLGIKTANKYRIFIDQQKENDQKRYKEWKKGYDVKRKKERFNFLRPWALTLLISGMLMASVYYGVTGEYKFLLYTTDLVKAEIVDTKMTHLGNGYYKQKIYFTFIYNDKEYQSKATIGKRVGKQQVGNYILLKIAKKKPSLHKIVGVYQ